jgi:NitT/TauT family transport system ATP-binding protein
MAALPYEYKETLLKVTKLNKSLGGELILRDLDLEIRDIRREGYTQGQVVVLLGPSGVGKTTLFRLLAGLDTPDSGTILVENGRPVERGTVGVVAQSYPLFEHRTVLSNLRVAGKMGHLSPDKTAATAKTLLTRFGLEGQVNKYPAQLSGGQRQRVAIAQQFMCSEHLLLMDEPFSGLDLVAEESVCALIREMAQTDELKTFVLVTHDIEAALSVVDTVWLIGRDRDAQGQIIPGARIQAVYNLIERGVAWQENNVNSPEYVDLLREIRTIFPRL